ncbi:hypothetical protein LPU83_pLPU83d_0505 (plasmid) [Rhizobium favelukesii]|uniref:Uncharacterized protein n=1 Tax=Rhizobium favelukesii TaxID=348824 RepID=W6S6M6_9HYPH|nr:hypothetical protein LPU83_pLPU83d_0505 [Rhizobium favelukesii]
MRPQDPPENSGIGVSLVASRRSHRFVSSSEIFRSPASVLCCSIFNDIWRAQGCDNLAVLNQPIKRNASPSFEAIS